VNEVTTYEHGVAFTPKDLKALALAAEHVLSASEHALKQGEVAPPTVHSFLSALSEAKNKLNGILKDAGALQESLTNKRGIIH